MEWVRLESRVFTAARYLEKQQLLYLEFRTSAIYGNFLGRFPRQIFESTYSGPISEGETTSASHARLTCSPTAAGLESATHRLLHIQPDL
jgi:hypothetical protein